MQRIHLYTIHVTSALLRIPGKDARRFSVKKVTVNPFSEKLSKVTKEQITLRELFSCKSYNISPSITNTAIIFLETCTYSEQLLLIPYF